ncbi:M48 family metallopeptidase [Clostridium tyrobutyricum]|uniref:M48 family metallopeptidase n=1 Tax=Clostridium tyrobutyricum TaxID=1519 RepID=UPI001C382F82|nr:SprT family zinc-dependent metalloprotease [Clostridium tyrobutyricum]MBV4420272.1 M48 family metallopeptidase [Clostridium tyrobutyricum]
MKIKYESKFITYHIIRKNIKNINIRVNNNGDICVTCPLNVAKSAIEEVINDKIQWIVKRLNLVNNRNIKLNELQIDNMKKVLFLGKILPVQKFYINTNKTYVKFNNDNAIICGNNYILSNSENIKKVILSELSTKLYIILKERIDIYKNIIKVNPNKITIRNQKSIWGSCSSNSNLSFNYRLIMMPLDIIDYIVVHELCHLVYMNHSKEYWDLVSSIISNYKLKKIWLHNNGYIINI